MLENPQKEDEKMKKKVIFAAVVVLVLAISLTALLVACDDPKGPGSTGGKERQENIFALAAVSAGELIGEQTSAAALAAGDEAAIAAELDEYMAMLDKLIGGENPITSVVADNTDEAYAQYAVKQTVTATSPDGSSETYAIYYNETLQPDYDDDDDPDEQEENYRIEGVMVNGENVFDITGFREVESERGESEESLEFTAENRENGLRMKFELENESEKDESGMEFGYEIYDGRSLVRAFEIEFERESGWMGEETEFELFTHENGVSREYEIESEVRGDKEFIRITRREGRTYERYRATRNDDGSYFYEYAGTGDRW